MNPSANSFRPAWWLPGGHLQTLYPHFLHRPAPPGRQRERLETPDGDFVDIDWYGPECGPIVMLVHGLTGSSRSHYILALQTRLAEVGLRSVALNLRGSGDQPNRLARAYHSGDTADLALLNRLLQQRQPAAPRAVVGFSLGGNLTLRWLAEQPQSPTFAAVAVSVPYQLDRCASWLDCGIARIYRNRLLHELRLLTRRKLRHLERIGEHQQARLIQRIGDLDRLKSFWDYDDAVVAPLHGFASARDYYQRCSSRPILNKIPGPTLLLHARNDPFMPADVTPGADELPSHLRLELSPTGGHMGFVAGAVPLRPRYWLHDRICGFILARLDNSQGAQPLPVEQRQSAEY